MYIAIVPLALTSQPWAMVVSGCGTRMRPEHVVPSGVRVQVRVDGGDSEYVVRRGIYPISLQGLGGGSVLFYPPSSGVARLYLLLYLASSAVGPERGAFQDDCIASYRYCHNAGSHWTVYTWVPLMGGVFCAISG